MAFFEQLIRFKASNGRDYWTDIGLGAGELPGTGAQLRGFSSIAELLRNESSTEVVLVKILAPVPREDLPIYCVGLNFHSHAKEASLSTTKYPPLWTKPAAALAHPDEEIPMNSHCATNLPDYEGELVFVTATECKDVTEAEAAKSILGYTAGNDLSCRMFQLQANSGNQFFYAKAFDKFAPLGPTLLSPTQFAAGGSIEQLRTLVNGKVVQDTVLAKDMVFTPAKILSHMSQGTTIPAGTAVMTGTPAGVGAFMKPKSFLQNGDVIEVQLTNVCKLRNTIKFS